MMLLVLKSPTKIILESAKYVYRKIKAAQNSAVQVPAVPFCYVMLFGQMEIVTLLFVK